MKKKRVRMIDVAEAAGVSRTAASFVLNGHDAEISEETRERVLRMARQMNYTPNVSARNLATGKTNRIGVVLFHPEFFASLNAYHLQLLTHITAAASRHNLNLLLHSATYPTENELAAEILGGASDGVLLVGRPRDDGLTAVLLDRGFPAVCISYQTDDPRCYSVDCDNEGGAHSAITYLLDLGHRHILFGSIGNNYSWERERLQGAQRAFQEQGIPLENLHQAPLGAEPLEAYLEQHLCRTAAPISAVYVSDERTARHLIELLPRFGRRVPQDISVICFDSSEVCARTRPPATGVWQPLEEIAPAAVDMLVNLIERKNVPERVLRFPTHLDIRESCSIAIESKKFSAS